MSASKSPVRPHSAIEYPRLVPYAPVIQRSTDEVQVGVEPEAALIFSCAVRRFLLGSRTGVEAELARSVYGPSMPMAGLYCFGEIGPVPGAATSRFFNETFTTVLLGT